MSFPQPYVRPPGFPTLPGNLSITQFIQTVMVGISGIPGELCRPKWQVEPPKQPDLGVNWMALGITVATPDANSFVGVNSSGAVISQRHETLEVNCDIYGPDAIDIADLIRDGFQIQTNLEALFYANMGFVEVGPWQHIPDLVNERFINRVNMSVFLRREIQRTYPIVSFISASGILYVPDISQNYMLDWNVPNAEYLATQSGTILETQSGEPIEI